MEERKYVQEKIKIENLIDDNLEKSESDIDSNNKTESDIDNDKWISKSILITIKILIVCVNQKLLGFYPCQSV